VAVFSLTSQPASQPTDYLTEYLNWNISETTYRVFLKFKLKLMGPNKIENCLKRRLPQMEDELKILKMEFLSNRLSDLPQILNLGLWEKNKIKNYLK
jgi:hypothetical protein